MVLFFLFIKLEGYNFGFNGLWFRKMMLKYIRFCVSSFMSFLNKRGERGGIIGIFIIWLGFVIEVVIYLLEDGRYNYKRKFMFYFSKW